MTTFCLASEGEVIIFGTVYGLMCIAFGMMARSFKEMWDEAGRPK